MKRFLVQVRRIAAVRKGGVCEFLSHFVVNLVFAATQHCLYERPLPRNDKHLQGGL